MCSILLTQIHLNALSLMYIREFGNRRLMRNHHLPPRGHGSTAARDYRLTHHPLEVQGGIFSLLVRASALAAWKVGGMLKEGVYYHKRRKCWFVCIL